MPRRGESAAARAVGAMAAGAPSVSLHDVVERAQLQVRVDRKYLVPAAELPRAGEQLRDHLQVLEIAGRRRFAYESRYFDTPSLMTYHEHALDRANRFKVRTRSYLESRETMFEVKLAVADGGTIKRRRAHPFAARAQITPAARRHLAAVLQRAERSLPSELVQTCVTAYRRTTFVTVDGTARITIDHDLVCSDDTGAVGALTDDVVVEVKSATGDSRPDRALARLGLEPQSMSKYCVGLALLHPDLPSAPWDALLERHFSRAPTLAAAA